MASRSTDTTPKRPDSFNEATNLLDEALIGSSAPRLQDLAVRDFEQVTSALGASAHEASDKVSDSVHDASDMARQMAQHAIGALAGPAIGFARDRVDRTVQLGKRIDGGLRANPWPVIGGVAAGALALGFLLGRNAAAKETVIR